MSTEFYIFAKMFKFGDVPLEGCVSWRISAKHLTLELTIFLQILHKGLHTGFYTGFSSKPVINNIKIFSIILRIIKNGIYENPIIIL